MRPVESLGHKQRELTPPAFAQWLVDQVRAMYGSYLVAALWVHRDSHYKRIAGVECYDHDRDAYTYGGPYPVICHPPCGPWGNYHHRSKQDRNAGPHALELAMLYGGVVEQPATSRLFAGGQLVMQGDWGHLATKPTRLWWAPRRA
jgi:hypothetical protein